MQGTRWCHRISQDRIQEVVPAGESPRHLLLCPQDGGLAFRFSVWNSGSMLSVWCSGSPECSRWSGAPLCFGFLHCGKPTATWLWTRALWLHAAGEQFSSSDVLLHSISKLHFLLLVNTGSPAAVAGHVCRPRTSGCSSPGSYQHVLTIEINLHQDVQLSQLREEWDQ